MAYEEYDYYNEPAGDGKSLKETLREILNGFRSEKNLRETGEGIGRVRQALPGVSESIARGAIAAVPGTIGDISDFARTWAPEVMEKKFGKERFFPTTREILDYVPRITDTHEGANTLEDVAAAISPGIGGVARDIAVPAAKAYGRFVGPSVYNKLEDFLVQTGGIQPITTWHGSKHSFDEFDPKKIGSASGIDYGHGLYSAEHPEIAKGFGKNLYKLDIPDEHLPKMIDWYSDTQTPEVTEILKKAGLPTNVNGEAITMAAAEKMGGSDATKSGFQKAAEYLHSLGIKGNKYENFQIKKGQGADTNNYVLYDPNDAKILEKNGVPLNKNVADLSKTIPTVDEYQAMVGKGQMRQARTFEQDLKDTLSGKVPGNKFDIPMEHSVDYESGKFTKRLEKAGLHVYDDKYGTVFVGKTPKDLEVIKNAETPIEHGLSYGYTPDDIAKFYTYRRGGRSDIGYSEFLDDLKHFQSKYSANEPKPFGVSTRVPTAVKATEDALKETLLSNYKAFRSDQKAFEHNIDLIKQYPNIALKSKNADINAEKFVEHVKDNLLYLHDKVPADTRARSKLWYEGANKIANNMAKDYNISEPTASGILAVLSPQKDWFMNVSLGERVASTLAHKQGFKWDSAMSDMANEIYGKPQYKPLLDAIKGKRLEELKDPVEKAIWIRTYDQAHNPREHFVVTPEGDFSGLRTKANGEPAKTGWGSNNEIAKAVSIFDNPTRENISARLGGEHKVRNFYMNIYDPHSSAGHTTIDTHAVAAGLLRPLSGNTREVSHNFGSNFPGEVGPKNSAFTGKGGTYGLYHEGYQRAAKERGVLPREMQSITWEAVRGLFPDTFKSAKNAQAIEDIWKQHKSGKISVDEAREQILEKAGGINEPEWKQ